MDNLENLTNDELRLKLLEHGFANMPVTSTTRKVLIKKLRNAAETDKSSTRRKTIALTKYSSAEEDSDSKDTKQKPTSKRTTPQPTNRRATIAAAPQSKEVSPAAEKITSRRRSGRTTPLAPEAPPAKTINKNVVQIPNIIEDSDEDDVIIVPLPERKKTKSRSPSLSKSETVTTSFRETVTVPTTVDESPEELESSADSELRRITTPFKSTIPQSVHTPDSRTTRRNPEDDYLSKLSKTINRSSISTSHNTYKSTSIAEPSIPTRRYTTHTFQKPYVPITTADDDDVDDAIAQAPFLSDFAQRLSRLRAEPLSSAVHGEEQQHYYRTSAQGRRSLPGAKQEDNIWSSFKTLLVAFRQSYTILILFVILVLIFAYVFFFN